MSPRRTIDDFIKDAREADRLKRLVKQAENHAEEIKAGKRKRGPRLLERMLKIKR